MSSYHHLPIVDTSPHMPSSRGGRPPGGSRAPPSAVLEVISAVYHSSLARYRQEHPGFIPNPAIERDFSRFCQVSLPAHPDAAYDVFRDLVEAVEEDPFDHTVLFFFFFLKGSAFVLLCTIHIETVGINYMYRTAAPCIIGLVNK